MVIFRRKQLPLSMPPASCRPRSSCWLLQVLLQAGRRADGDRARYGRPLGRACSASASESCRRGEAGRAGARAGARTGAGAHQRDERVGRQLARGQATAFEMMGTRLTVSRTAVRGRATPCKEANSRDFGPRRT